MQLANGKWIMSEKKNSKLKNPNSFFQLLTLNSELDTVQSFGSRSMLVTNCSLLVTNCQLSDLFPLQAAVFLAEVAVV